MIKKVIVVLLINLVLRYYVGTIQLAKEAEVEKEHYRIMMISEQVAKDEAYKHQEMKTRVIRSQIKVASRSYNNNDIRLLAQLIHGEAGGEPYSGKLAVGNVVLNRWHNGHYGKTLRDVIYASGQFDCVRAGWENKTPNKECFKAARAILDGYRVFGGEVLYFYNPETSTDHKFIKSVQTVVQIGHHVFAKRPQEV